MTPFFSYLLISTICLSICYIVYLLLFKNESRFLNLRIFLLGSMLISILLPLLPFSIQTGIQFRDNPKQEIILDSNTPSIQSTLADSSPAVQAPLNKEARWTLSEILLVIYLLVVCVILFGFIFQGLKIVKLFQSSHKRKLDGFKFVCSEKVKAPFSFLSWIFLPENLLDGGDRDLIIAHEKIHVTEKHSIDQLLTNLISTLMWFNPLVWRMNYSVQQVHEYLADQGVLRSGIDRKKYMSLMLNQAVEGRFISLYSSFNRSLLKKRMIMMTRRSSIRSSKYKTLVLIPLSILLLLAVACANGSKDSDLSSDKENVRVAMEVVKMHVVYVGADNPTIIVADGVDQSSLTVSIDNGKIRKEGDQFIINPIQTGSVNVNILKDGEKIGSKEFRALALPDPQVFLVLQDEKVSSKDISITDLVNAKGVSAVIPDFILDVDFRIVSYMVNVVQDGINVIEKSDSGALTDKQRKLLKSLNTGQRVIFEDIKAIGPDGVIRELGSMIFKIR